MTGHDTCYLRTLCAFTLNKKMNCHKSYESKQQKEEEKAIKQYLFTIGLFNNKSKNNNNNNKNNNHYYHYC